MAGRIAGRDPIAVPILDDEGLPQAGPRAVPPSQVSGRVTAWNKQELLSASVIISPRDGRAASPPVGEARIRSDGTFTFANVPAGRYVIRARGETNRGGALLFASFAVIVAGRDIDNVDLVLMPGATMEGHVIARATHGYPVPLLRSLRVRAPLTDGTPFGDTMGGAVTENGQFRLTGMIAGSHVLTVEGLRYPWRIEQAIMHGRDIASVAFDVDRGQEFHGARLLLTDTAAGVSGAVSVPPPRTVTDVLVVAFPSDGLKRRLPLQFVRCVRPSGDGTYELSGLAPGDYLVAAIIGLSEDQAIDPAVIDSLADGASPVALTEAQIASLPLSARPLRARVPSS